MGKILRYWALAAALRRLGRRAAGLGSERMGWRDKVLFARLFFGEKAFAVQRLGRRAAGLGSERMR